MEDRPMFPLAPSAVTITCTYDWRFGWSARVAVPGPDASSWTFDDYGPCSPDELVDAVAGALGTAVVAGRGLR